MADAQKMIVVTDVNGTWHRFPALSTKILDGHLFLHAKRDGLGDCLAVFASGQWTHWAAPDAGVPDE